MMPRQGTYGRFLRLAGVLLLLALGAAAISMPGLNPPPGPSSEATTYLQLAFPLVLLGGLVVAGIVQRRQHRRTFRR